MNRLRPGEPCTERGNLTDGRSIELLVRREACSVPTLATCSALAERGRESGLVVQGGRLVRELPSLAEAR